MSSINPPTRKKFSWPHLRGDQRGIAIVMAIFSMVLAVIIATEISYETQVEYVSASVSVSRLKAYYAAKAGVELSLFRILMYKKALAKFGDQLKDNKALLDVIWQFPFSWPPVVTDDTTESDKDDLKTIIKESTMDAQFLATIESEGGKIDINDLGSPKKIMSDGIRTQLLQLFDNEKEINKAFKKKYDNYDFNKLVNNIQDWVDDDKTSLNGGDEATKYEQPSGVKNYELPPNAPFKTVEELHMVAGMEDEFFDVLKDKITVYGTKGINVNYASSKVLEALDPQLKGDVLTAVLARRSKPELGGPFKDAEDFYDFLDGKGVRTGDMRKSDLPLLFDAEHNFRIVSSGQFANVRRQITAVTYDIDGLTGAYVEMLDKIDKEKNPQGDPGQGGGGAGAGGGTGGDGSGDGKGGTADQKKPPVKVPKGRPTVVFWQES